MEYNVNLSEAAIYVGTYAKYNSGSLFGKWLKLSEFANLEEFHAACAKLHKDEEHPEYMFQDDENIPSNLINEGKLSAKFFEVREAIESLDNGEDEAFLIWANQGRHDLSEEDIDELIALFKEKYIGCYSSEIEFVKEYVLGRHELSAFMKTYFDYELYTNDLFNNEYWFESGHVFEND